METRFTQHLKNLNKCVFKQNAPEKDNLRGAYNKIYVGKLQGVQFEKLDEKHKGVPTDPLMVFSMLDVPEGIKKPEEVLITRKIEYLHAITLLKKNNIKSPFIHHFLYCGTNGYKISQYAEERDLLLFLQKDFFHTKEDLRSWTGQLLLGLKALHEKNIVHRDIKVENVFVFKDLNNNIHLKLGDLDFLMMSHERKGYKGTLGYFPPEIFRTKIEFLQQDEKDIHPDSALYYSADKKAIDCYALGQLLSVINEESGVGDVALANLANRLRHTDLKNRFTVAQALEDKYFGGTKEIRQNYFDTLIQKFSNNQIYVDHYLSPHYPDFNYSFYLLPEKVKNLFVLTEKLQNQFVFIHSPDFKVDKESEKVMQNTANVLNAELDQALKDDSLKPFYESFSKLNVEVKKVLSKEYSLFKAAGVTDVKSQPNKMKRGSSL